MRTDTCCSQPVITQSVLKCPGCGHAQTLAMPTNSCLFFCVCEACHVVISPKQGDCCVFCSYGTVKCPPVQLGNA